jgi:thioester reductase-like protein
MSREGGVLLTGATGFIGMELLARYLERSDREVIVPVRAGGQAEASARLDAVLENLFGSRGRHYASRLLPLAADLTLPGLGLAVGDRDRIVSSVSTIVHCAASVSFELPLQRARQINVTGTRRMLELAELVHDRGALDCYAHLSTAYVAGTHPGRFAERNLEVGQAFHNSYEQSKFEAERLVHEHPDLPSTILRPSIVVGDRTSGWTAAFNVLYWPLRALSRGLFTEVPAIASAPVDVVSVDYVADAAYALSEQPPATGQTYHLTAGHDACTIGEITRLASRYFRRPAPRVVSPDEFAALTGRTAGAEAAIAAARIYFPYLALSTEFDDEATRARLSPAGIRCSPLPDYLERLLDFATRSRWGKQPIRRADALLA